jgi:Transposase IS66 family
MASCSLTARASACTSALDRGDRFGTAPAVDESSAVGPQRPGKSAVFRGRLADGVSAKLSSAAVRGRPKEALARIAALFQIEAEINGHGPRQRRAVRQERALPRLADLRAFLDTALASLSRKSALAVAIRYSLSRWQVLIQFVADGRLEMTNNAAEHTIRPLALGRNLCAAFDYAQHRLEGGRRGAVGARCGAGWWSPATHNSSKLPRLFLELGSLSWTMMPSVQPGGLRAAPLHQ